MSAREFDDADKDVMSLTEEDVPKLLEQEPERYPEHRILAASLEQWRDALKDPTNPVRPSDEVQNDHWVAALNEIAGLLRAGGFLPDGKFRVKDDQ